VLYLICAGVVGAATGVMVGFLVAGAISAVRKRRHRTSQGSMDRETRRWLDSFLESLIPNAVLLKELEAEQDKLEKILVRLTAAWLQLPLLTRVARTARVRISRIGCN
jgi:hypothetical protein